MFFKQTPAPWREHHAHQPCPLDGLGPWGVPRARLVTVVPRNFLATPGRTTDAHDARPHHQHQLHPPKQSPHRFPPRSTALDISANKQIPLNLDHSVFAAQFSLRFLLQSSACATISDLQGPTNKFIQILVYARRQPCMALGRYCARFRSNMSNTTGLLLCSFPFQHEHMHAQNHACCWTALVLLCDPT